MARRLTLAFWRGILARRMTLAFWSKTGGWGLAALKLDVVKRENMKYDLT